MKLASIDREYISSVISKVTDRFSTRRSALVGAAAFCVITILFIATAIVPNIFIRLDFVYHSLFYDMAAKSFWMFLDVPTFNFFIDGGLPFNAIANHTVFSPQMFLAILFGVWLVRSIQSCFSDQ